MESVTYAELRVLVEKNASALRTAGVVIGDRVAGKGMQNAFRICWSKWLSNWKNIPSSEVG